MTVQPPRRWGVRNMRGRLMLIILGVSMAPLLTVIAILGRWTYATVEDQNVGLQQEVARRVGREIESILLGSIQHLVILDDALGVGSLNPDAQASVLRNLLSSDRIYQELSLVGPDGDEVVRVSRSDATIGSIGRDWPDRPVFIAATESMSPRFGDVMFDAEIREPIVEIAVPLLNRRTGMVDFVLVADVRFRPIWDITGDLGEVGPGDIYVVSESGEVVAHRNPAVVLSGTRYELPDANGRAAGLDGDPAFIAVEQIDLAGQRLFVVVEEPSSLALVVATRVIQVTVGVALMAGLFAIALSRFAARRAVQPVEALAHSARLIAAGDLSHRAARPGSGELDDLAEAFNTMTNQLSGVIVTLEKRVRDRTVDLAEAAAVQRRLIEKLEIQALQDPLTALPNRFALDSRIDIELTRAERLESEVAIHLVDLDGFKAVNDTFGHSVGDDLLIAIGRRLREAMRDVDTICRLGGDEFAIVQPDIASSQNAVELAERLLGRFAQSFVIESQEIYASASIGISISNGNRTSKSDLMKRADLALYRAKTEGRSGYCVYRGDMETELTRRMGLAHDLRRAVDSDELFLEYQPQVGLEHRFIVGVEALLRWQHPKLGLITPSEFVPIAEGAGLIDRVGEWALRAACRQAEDWQTRVFPAPRVAVNISPLQLRDPAFVPMIADILAESALDPSHLELELTERVITDGQELVERAVGHLAELGIRISLDDFGKGHASLDYLRRLPLSKIKIDRSFVLGMDNPKNSAIVHAIIDLAGKLALDVIAEGVESGDLLADLIDMGCKEAQGFYFSQPVPAGVVEDLLVAGNEQIRVNRRLVH